MRRCCVSCHDHMSTCIWLFWLLFHAEATASSSSASPVVHPSRTTPWPWSLVMYHRGTEHFKMFQKSVFRPFSARKERPEDQSLILYSDNPQKKKRNDANEDVSDRSSTAAVLPPPWARLAYIITALPPILAVLFNDYNFFYDESARQYHPRFLRLGLQPLARYHNETATLGAAPTLPLPRVSFAVGVLLRALQLTTVPLPHVFDPTVGVGFGLNLFCGAWWLPQLAWLPVLVLGWSASRIPWQWLGATTPRPNGEDSPAPPEDDNATAGNPRHGRFGIWPFG